MKALHKAVKAMHSKTTIQYNKLIQLETSMLKYVIIGYFMGICVLYTITE